MSEAYSFIGTVRFILDRQSITRVQDDLRAGLRGVNVPIGVTVDTAGLRGFDAAVGRTQAGVRQLSAAASDAGSAVEAFGQKTRRAFERVAAYSIAGAAIYSVTAAIRGAVTAGVEFERQMARLSQVGRSAETSVGAVAAQIGDLSRGLGVSSRELADTAIKLRAAGLEGGQLAAALSAISKASLSPAAFGGISKASEALLGLRANFGVTARDYEQALGSVSAVSARFGVDAAEVSKAISTSGTAFRRAGGSLQEYLGLFSAMRASTREDAEAIGTSIRTIFGRLERPAVIQQLRELGVELQHAGHFVGPLEALQRLGGAVRGLSSTDPRSEAIGEAIGGTRNAARAASLLERMKDVQEALNVAKAGGISLDAQAAGVQGTLAQQTARLREELAQLGRNILADTGLRTLISDALKLGSAFVTIADAARPLFPLLTALAAVRIGQGIGSFVSGFARTPPIGRFATGGLVGGPPGRDRVPAMLTAGEFVVRRDAVSHNLPLLSAINGGAGRAPLLVRGVAAFASGGLVESHPLGNFPKEDFGGLWASVTQEAARLRVALSAATSVLVEFAASGPVFRGFGEVTARQARELRIRAYQSRVESGLGLFEDAAVPPGEELGQGTALVPYRVRTRRYRPGRRPVEYPEAPPGWVRVGRTVQRLEYRDPPRLGYRDVIDQVPADRQHPMVPIYQMTHVPQYGIAPVTAPSPGLFARLRAANAAITARLGRFASLPALYAANIGASYGADALNRAAGTADTAVGSGSETSYQAFRGAGGGLQTAVVGGVIGGSVGGPIGAAVGAVAGGLLGLVGSLKDAEGEIRHAQLGRALSDFGNKLQSVTNTAAFGGDVGAAAVGSRLALVSTQAAIAAKARTEATGFFGGFDAARFAAARDTETKAAFGGQLPTINELLGDFAANLAKNDPGARVDELSRKLREGNNGLNDALLLLVANLRGVPLATVLQDYTRTIQAAQGAARSERSTLAARQGEERQLFAFGRLASAAEAASSGLDVLEERLKTLADVFGGQLGATRVSGHADVFKNIGAGDNELFERAISPLAAAGGQQGRAFANAAGGVGRVSSILPEVLASVLSGNPLDKEGFAQQTERLLRGQLGSSPDVLRAITTVVGGLNQKGDLDTIRREAKTDPTKLAEQLLAPLLDAVKEYGPKFASQLEKASNTYIDGLLQARRQLAAIGENQDRLAQLRLGGLRQSALFRAEALGNPREAINFLSLRDLQGPFQARQERLTGLAGPAALDPAAIGARLARTRTDIGAAVTAQQRLFDTTGGRGRAFEDAAASLTRLKDRAGQLETALQHLANPVERNAAAQEKLSAIQSERQSRLGFLTNYLSSGTDERLRTQQGLSLLDVANRRGHLRDFIPEQQQLIIRTLGSLGHSELAGLPGRPAADTLLNKLVAGTFGGTIQDPANRAEEAKLQQEVLKGFRDAEVANKVLTDHLGQLNTDFISSLQATHAAFFTKLASELTRAQAAGLRVDASQAAAHLGELRGLSAPRGVLARAGVTTDAQLGVLTENRADLAALQAARTGIDEQLAVRRQRAVGAADDFLAGHGPIKFSDLIDAARGQHIELTTDEAQQVFDRTNILRVGREGVRPNVLADAIATVRQPRDIRELEEGPEGPLAIAGRLQAKGVPSQLLNRADLPEVLKAIDALKGHSLAGLDDEVRKATDAFQRLRAQLAALTGNNKLPVPFSIGLAGGGNVGGPKGTDTVGPVWLTPGEYVINAAATKANLGLLHQINEGRGRPVHLADGGFADEKAKWAEDLKAVRAENAVKAARRAQRAPILLDPAATAAKAEWANTLQAVRAEDMARRIRRAVAATEGDVRPAIPLDPATAAAKAKWEDDLKTVRAGHAAREAHRAALAPHLRISAFSSTRGEASPAGALAHPRPWAAANPGGLSGQEAVLTQLRQRQEARDQRLFASGQLTGRRLDRLRDLEHAERERALVTHFQRGQFAGLVAQQRAAHAIDPLSFFGAGRPGFNLQRQIDAHVAAVGTKLTREELLLLGRSNELNEGFRRVTQRQVAPFVVPNSPRRPILAFASGGLVPGTYSGHEDGRPAYLSEGEYVMSRRATQNIGVGNLDRMNAAYLAGGGLIPQYAAKGALMLPPAEGSSEGGGGEASRALAAAFSQFAGNAAALVASLDKFPRDVKMQTAGRVEVIINGAEALSALTGGLEQFVGGKIDRAIKGLMKERLPDA